MSYVVLVILAVSIGRAAGNCNCGEGGLCKEYNINPQLAVSATPCQCNLVSAGIFEPRTTECNTLVKYCRPGGSTQCGPGETCIDGYGTHHCPCPGFKIDEKKKCPEADSKGTSRFVRIFYYTLHKSGHHDTHSTWDLIVCGSILSNFLKIELEFDYERKISFHLRECQQITFDDIKTMLAHLAPTAWTFFLRLKLYAIMFYGTDYCYHCRVPMVFAEDRNVFIRDVAGPMGQYHDVKVSIIDYKPIWEGKSFRVFQESSAIVKTCGFRFEFMGCGKTPATADHLSLGDMVTLTVSAMFTVNEPDKCLVQSKTFEWFITPLIRSGLQNRDKVGTGRSITLDSTLQELFGSLYVIHVKVTLQNSLLSETDVIMGQCFLHVVKRKLTAFILHGDRFIMCEVVTKVVLECYVRLGFPENELAYQWSCPADLCSSAKLNSPTLEFNANVSCDQVRRIRVTVTFNRTRDSFTSTSVLSFVRQPYNIFVTCTPSCDTANPSFPLTLEASENPIYQSCFEWFAKDVEWDLSCSYACSSMAIVKPNTLSLDAIYNVTVSTDRGSQILIIQTAAGPSSPICKIEPTQGVPLLTEFNITCESTGEFLPLSFWIKEGSNQDLVTISTRNKTDNIRFSESLIYVDVKDSLGFVSSTNLSIALEHPDDIEEQHLLYFRTKLERLHAYLQDEDYMELVIQIDGLSKLPGYLNNVHTKHRLLDYLARVRECQWIECIIKAANSVRRLTSNQFKNETSEVDDYVLKSCMVLYTMAQSLDLIASKTKELTTYNMYPMLASIHDAVRQSMKLVDPFLSYPFLDEDVRQIHFRKVQEANTYARRTIAKLGLFATTHLPHPSPAFELISSKPVLTGGSCRPSSWTSSSPSRNNDCLYGGTTVIVSNTMEFINCVQSLDTSKSHFRFMFNKSHEFMKIGYQWSAAVVNFRLEEFWWNPENIGGEMFELHLYRKDRQTRNWTLVKGEQLNNVETFVKSSTDRLPTGSIAGQFHYVNNEKGQYPNVHRIIVPRGYGTLYLEQSEGLINSININQFRRSSFDMENMTTPNNSRHIVFDYYLGQGPQDLYIEISPNNGSSTYSVNYTVIQCVRRSEDLWKSESCRFLYRKDRLLVCSCRYMSLFNVETSVPRSSLVLPHDIKLDTKASYMSYTMIMITTVAICILGLFIFALYSDFKNSSKTAMFLKDNYPDDNYPYIIGLYTGQRFYAGTTSHVAVRLIGDMSISRVHILASFESNENFTRANDRWFILFTERKLGRVGQIELWHDSSGSQPIWYCAQIIVYDVESGKAYEFSINSWITATKLYLRDDTRYVIHENSNFQLGRSESWKSRVFENLRAFSCQELHWASVFILHPRSLYSRLDRTLILTVVILVTLVTSMMFYTTVSGVVDEPTVTYKTADFKVSLISMAAALIVSSVVSQIFSLEKERIMRKMVSTLKGRIDLTLRHKLKHFFHPMPYYYPIMTTGVYKKRKQQSSWMPYTICGIIIIFSIILITWECLKIHGNKSCIWFITFIVALTGEALLLNPAQVIIISVVTSQSHHTPPLGFIGIEGAPLENYSPNKNAKQRLDAALHYRVAPNYKPPLRSVLEKRAAKEPRGTPFWKFHALFIIFLFSFLTIIAYNMDVQQHSFKNQVIIRQLIHSKLSLLGNLKYMQNRTRYFNYLRATVMPTLHRMTWYNGKPLPTERNEPENPFDTPRPSLWFRGFCDDLSTKLIGLVLLRQQRVSPEWRTVVASEFKIRNMSHSYGYLTPMNQDKRLYATQWKVPREGEVYYRTYRYWYANETKAGWQYSPSRFVYSGDGYVANLHWSLGSSLSSLVDLELDGWLDNLTRCVFLSFSLYNIYVGEISSVNLLTEVLPSGVYRSQAKVASTSAIHHRLLNEHVIIVSVVSIAVILIVHTSYSALSISKEGMKYLSRLSGIFDVMMIAFGLFFIICFFFRYALLLDKYEVVEAAAKDDYISLDSLFIQNEISLFSISLFCFTGAAFSALLVHKLFGLANIEVAVVSIRCAIFAAFIFTVGNAITLAFIFYLLGTKEEVMSIPSSMFIKDMTIIQNLVGPSATYPPYLRIPVIALIVIIRLNIAILAPFYIETATMKNLSKKMLYHVGSRKAFFISSPRQGQERDLSSAPKLSPFRDILSLSSEEMSLMSILTKK